MTLLDTNERLFSSYIRASLTCILPQVARLPSGRKTLNLVDTPVKRLNIAFS
jgi:hypothetical protein